MARLPVEFFDPTAKQQLLDLPSKELKRRALELLAHVSKENPSLGKPCGFAFSTGNLSDCRKLYFDEQRDVNPMATRSKSIARSGERSNACSNATESAVWS